MLQQFHSTKLRSLLQVMKENNCYAVMTLDA